MKKATESADHVSHTFDINCVNIEASSEHYFASDTTVIITTIITDTAPAFAVGAPDMSSLPIHHYAESESSDSDYEPGTSYYGTLKVTSFGLAAAEFPQTPTNDAAGDDLSQFESKIFHDLNEEKLSDIQSKFIWAGIMVQCGEGQEAHTRLLPAQVAKNWQDINMKFTIVTSNVMTYFKVEVIIEDPDTESFRASFHKASLEWYLGGTFYNYPQIERLRVHHIIDPNPEACNFNVNWQSTNAVT